MKVVPQASIAGSKGSEGERRWTSARSLLIGRICAKLRSPDVSASYYMLLLHHLLSVLSASRVSSVSSVSSVEYRVSDVEW